MPLLRRSITSVGAVLPAIRRAGTQAHALLGRTGVDEFQDLKPCRHRIVAHCRAESQFGAADPHAPWPVRTYRPARAHRFFKALDMGFGLSVDGIDSFYWGHHSALQTYIIADK